MSGSLTGLLLSVGVAIVQFWPDWTWILATLAIFVFGQFVEGNILSPKLVGRSVGLHPVWLMFALLAFGSLFGFVGLLLAVPLAAAVGVIARLRRCAATWRAPLYHGGQAVLPPGPTTMRESGPKQLAFDLPLDPRASAGRTFSSAPRTSEAYGLVERWPDWPDTILLLTGPRGSGKSHLASIWAANARAWTVDAFEVANDKVPHLVSNGALVIEDADRPERDEAALFHLLNLARERRAFVLMTCASASGQLGPAHPRPAVPPAPRASRHPRAARRRAPQGGAGQALRRPPACGRHDGRGLHCAEDRALPAARPRRSSRPSTARP